MEGRRTRVRLFIARADGSERSGNGRARGIERVDMRADDERTRAGEGLIICTPTHIHTHTRTWEIRGNEKSNEHTYI